ncbi:hypothetical protein ZWY2020_034946 [Hordeum vulgare]|nr:hypothetical protein ZWY2020_034946 [Hordeum vulgare]
MRVPSMRSRPVMHQKSVPLSVMAKPPSSTTVAQTKASVPSRLAAFEHGQLQGQHGEAALRRRPRTVFSFRVAAGAGGARVRHDLLRLEQRGQLVGDLDTDALGGEARGATIH